MEMSIIEVSTSRKALKFEDNIPKTECIQQEPISNEEQIEFLTPMTDLIAQMIIVDIDKE
ncbi:MAG: hypothetical protein E7580_06015 [Ruminococcaceae bacterium]|nr:hypothetical protein [Oscillospiraceae bacterium]